jgi:hypothetical protein
MFHFTTENLVPAQEPQSLRSARRGRLAYASLLEFLESRTLLSAIPAPLTNVALGIAPGGSASFNSSNQTYTIVGGGSDIFAANDAAQYVYEPLTGSGTVTVEVTSDSPNTAHDLAGLCIRDSLSSTAANMWIASRDDGTAFADSRSTNGGTGVNDSVQAGSIPEYFKLTRNGDLVTGSYSTDGGNTYTLIDTQTINFTGNTVLVGMAVSSQTAPGTLATATFAHFSVVPGTTGSAALSAPTVSNTVTTPYQFTVTYTASAGVNASTIGNNNWIVTLPDGTTEAATLVTSGLSNGSPLTAIYQIPSPTLAGVYSISTGNNPVTDLQGTNVGIATGGTLGTFNVTEASSIVATLKSAPKLTSRSSRLYTFTVTYTAKGSLVNPLRIGNNNWVVDEPGGKVQATLLTKQINTAAAVVVATYSIPTPTVNGLYTIETSIDRAANQLGAQVAVGSIGTFTVKLPGKKA